MVVSGEILKRVVTLGLIRHIWLYEEFIYKYDMRVSIILYYELVIIEFLIQSSINVS